MVGHWRTRVVLLSAVALGSITIAACSVTKPEPADFVLRNGKIVTVDDARPEARALAVRDDTIVAVGSDADIQPLIGPATQAVDLGGKPAYPGFIDSHAHFTGIGQAMMVLNLMRARSWDEIVERVELAAQKAKPGEWIRGRGWHQEKWDKKPSLVVQGFPTHEALSKVSPANPVLLVHASGHATFANARAMELAGITKSTPNPPGGEIIRDARGNPTGVFVETAAGLIRRAMADSLAKRTPEEAGADARREIQLAALECLTKGITTVHDAGASFETVELYKQFADSGQLGVRLYVMLNAGTVKQPERLAKARVIGYAGNHLTVRAIKHYMDGALGSRGAWLLEPYADLPTSAGLNTSPIEDIANAARTAAEKDFQLCVHAIGDRANRETLNIFESVLGKYQDKKDLRWRIEHAQHIDPADIPRFASLGVIAAMQGIHCTSDAPYVVARLGEQRAREGAYAWQSLLRTKAVICNGTDAPVEDVNPIPSFHASVTRKFREGETFFPEQKMTRAEALHSYTMSGAYAAFEEKSKGSLAPGKLADIVVLSRDIMTIPEDEIPSVEVLYTIVGGKILHQKK